MKRYIRSSYTMSHENKLDVMKWLDTAATKINKFCKEHSNDIHYYEVDDVSWGTDCINIPVWEGSMDKPDDYRMIREFRFCYDRDDVFERSAEEQLKDAVDEFLEFLSHRVKK